MVKVLRWFVETVVVVSVVLFYFYAYQHNQAKKFIEGYGGKDVRVLGTDNRVMCSYGIGLVVAYTLDNEELLAPVCTDLFHDTELGQVKK